MKLRPCDGQILLHRLTRNPTQNMNAEFQPLRVNPIGQRLEARAACRRGKPARHRNENSVRVQQIFPLLQVGAQGVPQVPPLVDHHILPAKLLHSGQYGGIGLEVSLVNGQAIGIPTVPPHRRRGSGVLCVTEGCGGKERKKCGEENNAASHAETYTTNAVFTARWNRTQRRVPISRALVPLRRETSSLCAYN